ncbi:MAG TPA: protein-disulfide reductase DsbD domain-containing protein [Rhodocyclaceae bacterium]|nr:protein-disulfide reductase DsbD domain-containing protein [Rhodocyclaceae bacterium]
MPLFRSLHHLVFVGILLVSGIAHAISDRASTEQVQVQLIAATDSVRPGGTVTLGLRQRIIPHWHTYWQNAGDSGMPTSISWKLPAGAKAGDIQWPLPSHFELGSITNYGYADEVTLLTTISVPASAKPGTSFPIHASVNWLVCQEICIPQQVELALNLPIVAANTPSPRLNPAIQLAQQKLPVNSPWPASVNVSKKTLSLRIDTTELQGAGVTDVRFYPLKWGVIAHNAAQSVNTDAKSLTLTMQAGEAPLKVGETLAGVLTITENTANGPLTRGFNVQAQSATTVETGPSFIAALLLALIGGAILNLMPCVFPVLSIKALSLLKQGHNSRHEVRLHGLTYTAGILVSFALLAGLLLILKAGGAQIGWGFQFQSPTFVLSVAYLMFAVGLSLSGVFEIGTSVSGLGESLAEKPGYAGSFFTGVLATIVATPCTAPFMGVAIGYALTQPAVGLFAIFLSLGLGLALPYLLLSIWPPLQRCLPKPGLWMERLKQAFAFPMYATAAWLVWVLALQAGAISTLLALGGMVVIAFAAWLFDSTRSRSGWQRPGATIVAAALVIATLLFSYLQLHHAPASKSSTATSSSEQNWQGFSNERLQALRAEGKPVFLNFTAAWCITCLVNERVALSQDSVTSAFKNAGITYLKGDWTNQDAAITKKLAEFGRNGVPLYVFYPAGKNAEPVVLPQILTPEIVLEHIHPSH